MFSEVSSFFKNITGKSHEISHFATISHCCKGKNIFPFVTVTDGCEEANFLVFFHEYAIMDTTSCKFSQNMGIY